MKFTIETLPDARVVYVRNIGPYGPQNAQAMERLKDWDKAHQLLNSSSILLGIPQDHPLLFRHCKKPDIVCMTNRLLNAIQEYSCNMNCANYACRSSDPNGNSAIRSYIGR